jgi:sulfoxide reductase heme-binding subunit YedZ
LGANPIEFITRSTGTWALVFLCVTLAMTPLRLITGWPVWIKLRRMLGLFCFFYACIHFSIWFWLDQDLNLQSMWADVIKRPFITMGFLTLVLLSPLALTSNQWAVRQLGRRWALLHKLIYLIAGTAIVHYWWHKAGKNDLETVFIYGAVIFFLLACRISFFRNILQRKRSSAA